MSKLGNVNVRKNTGALVGSRNRLNLIEGANIALTIVDDAIGDEVDVTIAVTGEAWVDQFFPAVDPDTHKGAYAAVCGEAYNTHTDSIAATTTAVTTDEIECIDITAALTAATGGDVVGIQFIRTASHADDTVNATVYYLGILIQGSV